MTSIGITTVVLYPSNSKPDELKEPRYNEIRLARPNRPFVISRYYCATIIFRLEAFHSFFPLVFFIFNHKSRASRVWNKNCYLDYNQMYFYRIKYTAKYIFNQSVYMLSKVAYWLEARSLRTLSSRGLRGLSAIAKQGISKLSGERNKISWGSCLIC